MTDEQSQSDLVEFIERIRRHSPECLADFVPESVQDASTEDALSADQPSHDIEKQNREDITEAWNELEGLASIGRFQVIRKLGEGAFGLVFLAHDPQLDREVALKVPRIEALVTGETRKRFLREGRAAASLNHPNIATIHEAGQIGPVCYIVSAYCRGGSLADLIKDGEELKQIDRSVDRRPVTRKTSFKWAASLVAALARGVQHAHDQGILHRDLKPANILFEDKIVECMAKHPEAEPDLAQSARIVDFGLAKSKDHDQFLTQTGLLLGTPSYMSPEQAHGAKNIGPATDIYSLGAILYELLTGRPPLEKPSHLETIIAVKQEDPLPPRRVAATCPKDLEAICLKCLEKDPLRRYATAALLADDLERFQQGHSVLARAPSTANRAVRWCRRHPLASILAALVAAIAILGPLSALHQGQLYREAQQARQDERRALYLSDMQLALRDWDEDNLERCGELLNRHIPDAGITDYRGFEWYYLWRRWQATQQVDVVIQRDGLETIALSPDGETLALGNYDGTIGIWDRSTGQPIRSWQGHSYVTFDLAFSTNGKTLATANIDKEVKVWEVATGRELASFPGSRRVTFSPIDGTLAWKDGPSIGILDEGKSRARIIKDAHGHDEHTGVGDIAFSPDGRLIASVGWDHQVRIWDLDTGELKQECRAGEAAFWCMDWSPDGKYLAAGDVHGLIRLWDANTGQEVCSIPAHTATIFSVDFSKDSARLVSSATDHAVKIWNVPSGTQRDRLRGHYGTVNYVAFAEGGYLLSAGTDGSVKRWQLDMEPRKDVLRHPAGATSVAFSPDGDVLATSCLDGAVYLWNTQVGNLVKEFTAHENGVWRVRFVAVNDEQAQMVTTGRDGFLRLWDFETQEMQRELAIASGELDVLPLAVSADGTKLAFADSEFTVKCWDLTEAAEDRQFIVGRVTDIAFSPDASMLAVASGGDVKLRCVTTGRDICEFAADSRKVQRLAFSADGATLVTGSFDRTLKLWKLDRELGVSPGSSPRILTGPAGSLGAVMYSPDALTLASGGDDQVIRLWDPVMGQQRGALSGHTATVVDLAFSPDSMILASAANDYTVRIWRAPKQVE